MFSKLFGIGALDGPGFTRLVVKMGRERGLWTDPTVDENAMSIREGDRTMMLGNLHQAFLAMPRRERRVFIESRVLVPMPEAPSQYADAKDLLIPTVRATGYVAIVPLMTDDPAKARLVGKPLAPGLHTTVVVDSEASMSFVNQKQLDDWGVTYEEAFEHALSRLRTSSQDPFVAIGSGLWVAPWNDYAAARVLLPDVLQRVCIDPYVMVPNRDLLVLGDPRDPSAFDKLVVMMEDAADKPYAISRRIYQLENTTLREATPPATTQLGKQYRTMMLGEAITDYGQEAERMNMRDEGYYASIMAFALPDGSITTRAVWTKGADPTFLPPVDEIMFLEIETDGEKPRNVYSVPWAEVIAAGLATPSDGILPRWQTGTYPSAAWLAEHGTPESL